MLVTLKINVSTVKLYKYLMVRLENIPIVDEVQPPKCKGESTFLTVATSHQSVKQERTVVRGQSSPQLQLAREYG